MYDLELEWTTKGGGSEKHDFYCPTPPLSFLLTIPQSLSFYQPSTTAKLKDGSYNLLAPQYHACSAGYKFKR